MTKVQRHQLIQLGILTKECAPIVIQRKLAPELKPEARRPVEEKELIFRHARPGLLVSRILALLKIGLES